MRLWSEARTVSQLLCLSRSSQDVTNVGLCRADPATALVPSGLIGTIRTRVAYIWLVVAPNDFSSLSMLAARALNVVMSSPDDVVVICGANDTNDDSFAFVEVVTSDPVSALVARTFGTTAVAVASPSTQWSNPTVIVQSRSGDVGCWERVSSWQLRPYTLPEGSLLGGVLKRTVSLPSDVLTLYSVREWAISRWVTVIVDALAVLEPRMCNTLLRTVLPLPPGRLLTADGSQIGRLLASTFELPEGAVSWEAARQSMELSGVMPEDLLPSVSWCDGPLFHAMFTRQLGPADIDAAFAQRPEARMFADKVHQVLSTISGYD